MARRRPPFEARRNGYTINLDEEERHFVRRLVGEVRELLTSLPAGDPKMGRLFPPAYTNASGQDADAEAEYQRLMRDELVASRLDSIGRIDELLADTAMTALTAEQLNAFVVSLNAVRLILGTILGITDEDDDEDPDSPLANEMAMYNYLSWLLDSAVTALMQG
ncbi:MAG: hypothetical protein RLZ19_135 [Actinomycetota bacterium]|jgi:hypothetical protein